MSYHLRNINHRHKTLLGASGLAFLVVIFLLRTPISYALHAGAFYVSNIFWPLGGLLDGHSSQAVLTEEVGRLKVELARFGQIQNENEALKKELGYVKSGHWQLAMVLSSLRSSPYETIVIDQGTGSAVQYGQRVVSEEGVALGLVVEVYQSVSKVELYSAYGKELEVELEDGTRVRALGAGSQNFSLKLPRGLLVTEGSSIFLPSSAKLVLAKVERIKENPGDAFQIIYARSPVNINNLSRVYVEN